ncbi:hypothetical protein L1987_40489 [Smallanthus sonchifolius]|uniref:Uncharacterized protein n=1 Tax=Smallanthus sonchifolius TaxID=185202 RepID=A0ACB9GT70_9ASTR|nr:hypothetical protein L1987_40489 [Smallanthus sonchifolius]
MTLLRRSESPWGYSKMQQFIKRPDSLFLSGNDSSFVIHSINQMQTWKTMYSSTLRRNLKSKMLTLKISIIILKIDQLTLMA